METVWCGFVCQCVCEDHYVASLLRRLPPSFSFHSSQYGKPFILQQGAGNEVICCSQSYPMASLVIRLHYLHHFHYACKYRRGRLGSSRLHYQWYKYLRRGRLGSSEATLPVVQILEMGKAWKLSATLPVVQILETGKAWKLSATLPVVQILETGKAY